MPIVKSHRLNLDLLEIADARDNGNGGKTIYLNYQGGMFKMQTPKMTMPYNMSVYDKGEYPKYSIDVAFRDVEEDYRVRGFHENMNDLQTEILQTALDNSKKWFSKTHKSVDVLSALFTPLVKRSIDRETGEPDGRYPDTMKFKLPVRDGKPGFVVTDFEDNVIENPQLETLLTKESKVQALLRCGGIWVIAGKFGCTWTVERLRVESSSSMEGGVGANFFVDDDSQDEDEDEEEEDSSDDDSDDE